MTAASRTQQMPFLPPAWAASLKRATWITCGGVMMVLAAMMGLALITYNAADPSMNTATDAAVTNAMGAAGAAFADLALQVFGAAAGVIVLVFGAWAARVMRQEPLDWLWLRTLALISAMLLIAAALEALPAPAAWPLSAGLGGSAGDVLIGLAVIDRLVQVPPGVQRGIAAFVALVAGLGLLSFASTVPMAAVGAWFAAIGRTVGGAIEAAVQWPGRVLRIAISAIAARTMSGETDAISERAEPRVSAQSAARKVELAEVEIDDEEEEEIETPVAARAKDIVVTPTKSVKAAKREMAARQGSLLRNTAGKGFSLPHLDILTPPPLVAETRAVSKDALESNARLLETVLDDFGIKGQIVKVRPGPVVTLYELEPAPGTKTSRVVSLADDIARSMSAVAVRIAVIPGRSVIGIELPNQTRETVYLREMLASEDFERNDGKLILALGKDIGGAPILADLARMPHLLIAGTTGSGKSVAVNTMIMSLLYRNTPAEVRFIMIDPKMLELSVYDGIPHLLAPVVTEPGKAVMALKWVVREMENRYRAMSQLSVRNVAGYNQRLQDAAKKGQKLTKTVQTGFDPETGKPVYEQQELDLTPLPFIVVIIDEMADLMLVAGKDVEAAVQRLAQMARAAGIHVIMATQRPSVDVITGTIKANFPTRISFQVTSKIDSRTILGEQGAEQLLGQGDMLYMAAGGRITRVHGPFVSDKEVEEVTTHLRDQGAPDYLEEVTEEADVSDVPGFANLGNGAIGGNTGGEDSMFDKAVAVVARERKASTSFIQRHLRIGYNSAARIIEQMEAQGMIGKPNHVGKREVLLPEPAEF